MRKLLTFIMVLGVALFTSAQCITSNTCDSGIIQNDFGSVGNLPNSGNIDSIEYTISGNIYFAVVDSVVGSSVFVSRGSLSCSDTAKKTRYFYSGHPVGYTCNVHQALPVEFITLSATLETDYIQVYFMTASENNNSHFVLEKFNGEKYLEITKIKGSGNSVGIRAYFVLDHNVENGNNIYRVKQVDFDGKFEYSQAFKVKIYKPELPDSLVLDSDRLINGYDLTGRKVN